ncbi:hypothetical protein ACOME3_010823 [Neoechinorhynchus agilis]
MTTNNRDLSCSIKYEYLDHTADVQLHGWGSSVKEAFEQCGLAMFAYMTTDIDSVEMLETREISVEEDDMLNLLYHFLDELLFLFCCEPFFIGRRIQITEFDKQTFKLKARVYGEEFQIGKHPQGTEVKAITYSKMEIVDNEDNGKGDSHVYAIIDI